MSDQDRKPFYITTAIAYTSSKPHIGNTYDPVLADAIARYKRQRGFDVYFQTGSDEHGQKIQLAAEKEGISPKAYVCLLYTSTLLPSRRRMKRKSLATPRFSGWTGWNANTSKKWAP